MGSVMQDVLKEFDIVYKDPLNIFQVNDIVCLIPGISIDILDENDNLNRNSIDENGYCLPSVIQYFLVPKPNIRGNILACVLPLENNYRKDDSWFCIVQYLGFGLIKRPGPNEIEMVDSWSKETIRSQGKPTRYLSLYGSIRNKVLPTIRMITIKSDKDEEEKINV